MTFTEGLSYTPPQNEFFNGQPRRVGQDWADIGDGKRYYIFYAGDHTDQYPAGKIHYNNDGGVETAVESSPPQR